MNILNRFTKTADVTPEQRRADALQAYEAARSDLGVASLDYDAAAVEVARKSLAKAESALVEADLALDAQRAREAAAIAGKMQADTAARWTDAERIAKARVAVAAEAEATAAKLAAQMGELLRLSFDLLHAVPKQPGDAVTLLCADAVTRAVRMELVRAGLSWALPWPYSRHEIPPLSSHTETGNAVALRERSAA